MKIKPGIFSFILILLMVSAVCADSSTGSSTSSSTSQFYQQYIEQHDYRCR